MPKLTPVNHNPFAGDMANAMGQGQMGAAHGQSPSDAVLPDPRADMDDARASAFAKWAAERGYNAFAGDDSGDGEGVINMGKMAQDLQKDLTRPPQGFDPASVGATLAPDGNHYLTDPNRAGKYLLLKR